MSDSMGKEVWQAAYDGKEAELRRLIERGGSVNWHNPQSGDSTALIQAAKCGHEGCVRLLLESKASVNATDIFATALHWAAYNGYLAIAKRLLEGGADPTLRNKFGETALDYARERGKSDIVALLSEPRYTPRGTQSDRCMIATISMRRR